MDEQQLIDAVRAVVRDDAVPPLERLAAASGLIRTYDRRGVLGPPRTQEQKVAFRKAWDARVDAAKEQS